MPKNNNFDWSSLDRKKLIKFFYEIYPEIIDKDITISKFHKIISNKIKSYLPILIRKKWEKDMDSNIVMVGGTYYRDNDKAHKKCITLELYYKFKDVKLKLSARGYRKICTLLADTTLHEIIHMRQYRRRKFKLLPDYASTAAKTSQRQVQTYFGHSDEIDAYSFNIACDLMSKFKNNQKKVIEYLSKKKLQKRDWNNLKSYLAAFDNNHNHPIIKRLKKKIVRYLPNAEIGKPYKSKDWINY
jgi:hypothetical protein